METDESIHFDYLTSEEMTFVVVSLYTFMREPWFQEKYIILATMSI
jgi:hypothetical protein